MYKILLNKYEYITFKRVPGRVQRGVVVGFFFSEKDNCVCATMYEHYNGISHFF